MVNEVVKGRRYRVSDKLITDGRRDSFKGETGIARDNVGRAAGNTGYNAVLIFDDPGRQQESKTAGTWCFAKTELEEVADDG